MACSSSSFSGGSGWKTGDQDAEAVKAMRLVVIVGSTGIGKTNLSINAARAVGGDVVNTDKIQLHAGLDVTTNKVPLADRRSVPHHLLGPLRPDAGPLPPSSFRSLATSTAASIAAQVRVPDRKSTRLNSSHITRSRMPSSA